MADKQPSKPTPPADTTSQADPDIYGCSVGIDEFEGPFEGEQDPFEDSEDPFADEEEDPFHDPDNKLEQVFRPSPKIPATKTKLSRQLSRQTSANFLECILEQVSQNKEETTKKQESKEETGSQTTISEATKPTPKRKREPSPEAQPNKKQKGEGDPEEPMETAETDD